MRKLLLFTLLFSVLNPVKSVFAALIEVEYSVDFTSYYNNTTSFDPALGLQFATSDEQEEYLTPDDFFLTVLYDTNRDGILFNNDADKSVLRGSVGIWAEIVDTNIRFTTANSDFIYNYLSQISGNRGTTTLINTVLAGTLGMVFDYESIEQLEVGASSFSLKLEDYLPGEYPHIVFPNDDDRFKAYNGYEGVAVVQSITYVPEPSTLAIFALGIMGLASRRFKKQS
jgi:hypothetical protein